MNSTTMQRIRLGAFSLTEGPTTLIAGETTSKLDANGDARCWDVTGPGRLHLTIADITWSSGERDIRTLDRHSSPQRFDRLCRGLRLGVAIKTATAYAELWQARTKPNGWSNICSASLAELDAGAGLDCTAALHDAGAIAIGRRQELLADQSRRRNQLCVTFNPANRTVPVVAYTLTRIAPIHHLVTAR